jgi:hypothetical protein
MKETPTKRMTLMLDEAVLNNLKEEARAQEGTVKECIENRIRKYKKEMNL